MQHFSYWGGKIEHFSLCRHCIQTFATAKVLLFFEMCKFWGINLRNLWILKAFCWYGLLQENGEKRPAYNSRKGTKKKNCSGGCRSSWG